MGNLKIGVRGLLSTLVLTVLLSFLPWNTVNAEDKKVRVGYFLISGYQEITEDGNRWGFGYDYLQEIAKYTDWEYEFVDASWEECAEMLERGELDLLTCMKRTPERMEIYDYSSYRMGILCSVLTVRSDNDNYCYNDYESFDGMKVGMIKGYRTSEDLKQIYAKYNISMEEYVYDTEAETKDALNKGEIDAIASNNQRILENEKIIARFDLGPFFAVTKKDNTKLLHELNRATEQLVLSNAYFEIELNNKYFGENAGFKIALTKEEKQYANLQKTIRMAASPHAEPMCFYDGKQYAGIVVDCMKAMAAEAGMELKYIETDSYKESLELLRSGQVDVIGDFYYDYSWGKRNKVVLSNPYLNVGYVEVFSKGKLTEYEDIKIATCEDFFFNNMYILKHYPKENLIYYDTERDCIAAVRKGQADITFVNEYTAKILLEKDKNLHLNSNTLYNTNHGLSVGVSEDNKMLYQIMSKSLACLSSAEIKQIIERYTVKRDSNVSLLSYIYYNSLEFMLILLVFCLIIVLVLIYIIFVKRKYNRHIFMLAYYDSLTGLNNIHRFEELAEKRWLEYRGKTIFILSFDISHFTTINETYGRMVGDMAICYVGEMLKDIYGEIGIVARSKVDNFLVFGIYNKKEEIKGLVSRIKNEISIFRYEDTDIYLNYNMGLVLDKGTASTSIKKMIDRAEMARKAAKKDSTHLKYFNDEMEELLLKEKMIEDSVKSALENGEFKVYYQPKYRMSDAAIIGAEALVRWDNKECGFMSPAEFIPIFENNGYIIDLDFFVLEEVYKMLRQRIDNGESIVRVSVNQSRIHFTQNNYISNLNALREKYQIPRELIELELTESIFASMTDISKIVTELKANGYYLSVDDFGSGYSSLNMLKEIPLDTLKIDKDFLSSADNSGRYRKVIKKVVELAEDLDMDIICEGVEKKEQAEFLQSVGCLYAQGFLYAKPMPQEEFLKILK